MRVLITGDEGFIGKRLKWDLFYKKYKTLGVDKKRGELIQDVRDKLFNDFKPNTVVHLAAIHLPEDMKDYVNVYDTNYDGVDNMLKRSAKNGVKRFIFISSAAVYGNTHSKEISPNSVYAVSKYTGENLVEKYRQESKLETITLRWFNVYGNGDGHGIVDRLQMQPSVRINGDGSQTRDFVYVEDVCRAITLAVQTTNPNAINQVYNVGTGKETSISDLVKWFSKSRKIDVTYGEKAKHDIQNSKADITKTENLLRWHPSVNLRDFINGTRR